MRLRLSESSVKYFQTPYDRWLAPTNSKDAREATRALKKFKEHKWQALEFLATTFPLGVELADEAVQKKEESNV